MIFLFPFHFLFVRAHVCIRVCRAIKSYKIAANQGSVKAQFNLALCHYTRFRNVQQGAAEEEIVQKPGRSSKKLSSHKELFSTCGERFAELQAAANWFRRAASQGCADSQFNLGCLYSEEEAMKASRVSAVACMCSVSFREYDAKIDSQPP